MKNEPIIKVPEWTITTPASLTKPELPDDNFHLDKITYVNGRFFCETENEREELSFEAVAELLMKVRPQPQIPRVDFSRSGTYIRYSLNKDANNTTKVFGKDCMYYILRFEDYIFLLDLLKRSSSGWAKPLTWQSIRWLLGQSLQPRNLPSLEQENYASEKIKDHKIGDHGIGDHKGLGDSWMTGVDETKGSSITDGLIVNGFSESVAGTGAKESNESSHLPPALSAMSFSAVMNYKKMMGPYVTDEVFSYLINIFELITANRECISNELAFTEARERLGILTPTARILREIIEVILLSKFNSDEKIDQKIE